MATTNSDPNAALRTLLAKRIQDDASRPPVQEGWFDKLRGLHPNANARARGDAERSAQVKDLDALESTSAQAEMRKGQAAMNVDRGDDFKAKALERLMPKRSKDYRRLVDGKTHNFVSQSNPADGSFSEIDLGEEGPLAKLIPEKSPQELAVLAAQADHYRSQSEKERADVKYKGIQGEVLRDKPVADPRDPLANALMKTIRDIHANAARAKALGMPVEPGAEEEQVEQAKRDYAEIAGHPVKGAATSVVSGGPVAPVSSHGTVPRGSKKRDPLGIR